MLALSRQALTVLMAWAMTACSAGEPPVPLVETQANEQGCVRVRSTGPQDPAAIPVPIKQACVGPYLLELPQNYFYNQMGTEFDGSFALALEYPSLKPFKPGERSNISVDVGIRTVTVTYDYIDRIDIRQAMRNSYSNMVSEPHDPAASLEGRELGEPIFGLTPYYADMARIRAYEREHGRAESAPVMQDRWHKDWFLRRSETGEVTTVIKCTSRNVKETGVEYRNGKIAKNKAHELPYCEHIFTLEEHDTKVRLHYARIGLPDWRRIEERARMLFERSLRGPAQVHSDNRRRQK
ncbi:hypothetical protein [Xanthomonas sp. 60]